ncbi:uncharacterized protein WCC33_014197 [Rhinophrynus dorsalis]
MERYIIVEIDRFYPRNIVITWSKAESKPKHYKTMSDSHIQNKLFENSDSTFRLTSICEAMTKTNLLNPNDFYFNVKLEHESLTSPIELAFLREGDATLQITAPSPHNVVMGSDVTLPCTFTISTPNMDPLYLSILWFFQGKEIVRLDSKGFSSNERVIFSVQDTKKGIASLRLPKVTESDIGTYKCMVVYSPESQTKEIVLNAYARPTISMLEKLEIDKEKNMVVCTVTGFYPKEITVTLLKDGKAANGAVVSNLQMNEDGTFNINTTLVMLSTEKPRELTCKVQHRYLAAPLQKDIRLFYEGDKSGAPLPLLVGTISAFVLVILVLVGVVVYWMHRKGLHKFMVNDIQGPPSCIDGQKVTLSCTAAKCTKDADVLWVIRTKGGTECQISDSPFDESEEGQPLMAREYLVTKEETTRQGQKGPCDFTSSLTFIPSLSKHEGTTVTCRFKCGKKTEEKTYELNRIYVKPTFSDPVQLTLSDSGDVQVTALLRRFYPNPINISWSSGKEQPLDKLASKETAKEHSDNTFDVESKCSIPGDLFKDPTFKVRVTWNHKSMDLCESKEISVKDFPWPPRFDDRPIQIVLINNEITLNCDILRYFPDALTVKWFEKKKGYKEPYPVSDSETHRVTEIISRERTGNTFACQTRLSTKRAESSQQGLEYICWVDHPCLNTPIQKSTGPLQDNEIQTYIVNNIQGPQKWTEGEKVTLYCIASYCSEDVQVTWIVTERDGTVREISDLPTGKANKEGDLIPSGYVANRERTDRLDVQERLEITTSLTFTPCLFKHKTVTVKCKFVCDGKSKEKTFERKCLYAKPTVLEPIKTFLTDSGNVLCHLDILGFYPKDIQISWSCGARLSHDKMESKEEMRDKDLICDVRSKCEIPGRLFRDPDFTVKVSWKHESMETWESRPLSLRDQGFQWRPEVQDIPLPNLFINSPVTLMCKISNIFPESLSVKWLIKEKDGQGPFPLTHSEKYRIPDIALEKQADNTFLCRACLTFTPSISSEQGVEFICRVDHPSLDKPKERGTGALQIRGFPVVKEICQAEDGTYTLNVDGVYPKIISISWNLVLQSSTGENKTLTSSDTFTENENGSFRFTSTCDLEKNGIDGKDSGDLKVTVEHEALDSPIHRIFSLERSRQDLKTVAPVSEKASKEITTPNTEQDYQKLSMSDIQGPQEWTHGKNVTLSCTASYCTQDVKVTWIIEEKDKTVREICDIPTDQSISPTSQDSSGYVVTREQTENSDKQGLVNIISSVRLTPSVSKHAGGSLKCQIICDGETKEKTFQRKSIYAKPKSSDPLKLTFSSAGDMLCCLNLHSFYPKEIDIRWECGAGQSPDTLEPDNKYKKKSDLWSVTSTCKIHEKLLKDPTAKIQVTWKHVSMDQPESRTLCIRDKDFPWRPEMEDVIIPNLAIDKEATLQCYISKYFPDALTVTWYKIERGGQETLLVSSSEKNGISTSISERALAQLYICKTNLNVTPLMSDQGAVFICRVDHPSLERPIEKRTRNLEMAARPLMIQPVAGIFCYDSREMVYTLKLQNFYPNYIHIDWNYKSGLTKTKRKSTERFTSNADLTWNVESQCKVPGRLLKDRKLKVSVTWEHETMNDPEIYEISVLDPGFWWNPEIGEIVVPDLYADKETTLQCKITKCLPWAVTCKWYRKAKGSQEVSPVSPDQKYKIPKHKEDYTSLTCTASLVFTPSPDTDDGAEFICQLGHPGLEKPIEKRTRPLKINKMETSCAPFTFSGSVQSSSVTGFQNQFSPDNGHISHQAGGRKRKRSQELNDRSSFSSDEMVTAEPVMELPPLRKKKERSQPEDEMDCT